MKTPRRILPALSGSGLELNPTHAEKPHPLVPRPEVADAPRSRRRPREGQTAMLAARIPVGLRNQFKAKAAAQGMTVAEVVLILVQQFVTDGTDVTPEDARNR